MDSPSTLTPPVTLRGFNLKRVKLTVPTLCLAGGVSVFPDLEMGFHEGSADFSKEVSQDLAQQNPPAYSDSPTDSPLALAPPSFPFWSAEETSHDWKPFEEEQNRYKTKTTHFALVPSALALEMDNRDQEETTGHVLKTTEPEPTPKTPVLGPHREAEIWVKAGTIPIGRPAYRLGGERLEAHNKLITDCLEKGKMSLGIGGWNLPSFPVQKANGKFRLVQDFRLLNAHTEKDAHPLPRIIDILPTRIFEPHYEHLPFHYPPGGSGARKMLTLLL